MIEPLDVTMAGPVKKSPPFGSCWWMGPNGVYVAEAGLINPDVYAHLLDDELRPPMLPPLDEQVAYDSFSDDEFIGDIVDPLDASLDAIVDAVRELDNMEAQPRYILLNGFGRRLLAMQKILKQPFF